MNRETLSKYGWIIICVIVLGIIITIAAPFGNQFINSFAKMVKSVISAADVALSGIRVG